MTQEAAQLFDLTARRASSAGGDLKARGRRTLVEARTASGLSLADFALVLSERIGFSATADMLKAWESAGSPPGEVLLAAQDILAGGALAPTMRLIAGDHPDLQVTMAEVVDGAQQYLAVTGSRSRDARYLARIESVVAERSGLHYYRALYGPPRHGATKQHLLRLVDLALGDRVQIGYLPDPLRDHERFMVVNEQTAVIIQPSVSGILNFDTALHVVGGDWPMRWVEHVAEACMSAEPITTREQVERMEVVR